MSNLSRCRRSQKLIPKDALAHVRLAAKFLSLVSHFLCENYTIPDARRCWYRQCFTENCQKVGETRVDSKERSPSIVRDGITRNRRREKANDGSGNNALFKF